MRVALGKLDGVDRVEVSLEAGVATVRFGPGARTTIEEVRRVVRNNGFHPKAATVVVGGTLEHRDSVVMLAVAGSGPAYTVAPEHSVPDAYAALRALPTGTAVELEALVPETARGERPTLGVRRVVTP